MDVHQRSSNEAESCGALVPRPSREGIDSQFDSHGIGKRRMKRTRAETGTHDLARSGRARTPFSPPFTSVTRVQIPSGTPMKSRSVLLQAGGGQSPPLLVLQKIQFFLRGLSSEGIVSTWEPSKSPDYFQMLLGVLQDFGMVGVLRGQRTGKPHRLQLIVQIFAMFERKVQEHPHQGRQLAVESSCDSVAG